jgi:hypothetical protein
MFIFFKDHNNSRQFMNKKASEMVRNSAFCDFDWKKLQNSLLKVH